MYATTGKAINIVTNGSGTGISTGDHIYFGTMPATGYVYKESDNTSNPYWRVLNVSEDSKAMFVMAESLWGTGGDYGDVYLKQDGSATSLQTKANDWNGSDAQRWCGTFTDAVLSSEERGAIKNVSKHDDAEYLYSYNWGESSLSNEKVFFLSVKEVYDYISQTEGDALKAKYNGTDRLWWLRSPVRVNGNDAGLVDNDGDVNSDPANTGRAARPAFNIDLESVILTSAAVDGKDAGSTTGTLKKIADYSDSDWKLTILDSSHSSFTASTPSANCTTTTGYTSWTVPVKYSGAVKDTNEYVSAILTDSNGVALYYGHIAVNSASSTGVDVTIPTGLEPGTYKLNVFGEQCNGNKKTDLFSSFRTITLTVNEKYDLEYDANGGSGEMDPTEVYNGGKYIFPQCSFTPPSKKRFDHWEIVGVDLWGYPNDEVTIDPGFVTGGKITVTASWKDMAVVTGKPKGMTLKYNGSEQKLVSAGTAENGTMNYALGDDDTTAPTTGWSEDVPKRKDKGTYYVWYKAKGNDGYADSDPGCTTATISDKDPVRVEKVELSDDKLTLSPGESGQLTATIVPEDATDKEVSWAVDDESVAKISSDDKECTVTAVAAGETTVTVTTKDGGKEAVCTVIVEDKPGPKPEKCTITFDANGGEGEMKPQSGNKGNTVKLKANVFKRSGYEFKNWNTKADGSGDKYDNKQSVELKEDMTLYAQWEKGKPEKDDDDDDDEEESTEPSKPAVVNPDTVEGFFAAGGQPVPGVAMGKTKQGVAAQTLLDSARPAGYLQAFTFNMAVNGKVDYTLKNGVLTIIIPKEFQKAGRTFAIMALDKNGKAWTFADTDTNPSTVTATINVEGYAFALIYKD